MTTYRGSSMRPTVGFPDGVRVEGVESPVGAGLCAMLDKPSPSPLLKNLYLWRCEWGSVMEVMPLSGISLSLNRTE